MGCPLHHHHHHHHHFSRPNPNPTHPNQPTKSRTGAHAEGGPEWCIYVTNWTAALMGGYAWAALLATLLPRVRWLDRAAWFLHSVAAPLTVMVTVLYWA